MNRTRWLAALLAAFPVACLGKANAADPTGFAAPAGANNPLLPFHRVWRDRDFDLTRCDRVRVPAVDTDYLIDHTWWQGFGRGSKAHEDVVELAAEFRALVVAAFESDPEQRLRVVGDGEPEGGADTLVLELAIVELVPQKAVVQLLTYPAGPFGMLARQGMDGLGATCIAIEGRLRVAATGAVVATFADREQKKAGLLNLKNFTWYGHVREILAEWAEQFRQVANKTPGEAVPDTPAFRLLPW